MRKKQPVGQPHGPTPESVPVKLRLFSALSEAPEALIVFALKILLTPAVSLAVPSRYLCPERGKGCDFPLYHEDASHAKPGDLRDRSVPSVLPGAAGFLPSEDAEDAFPMRREAVRHEGEMSFP